MATPNLALPEVSAAQDQKEVTINDTFGKIDVAMTDVLAADFTAGDVTLTTTQARAAQVVKCNNVTTTRQLNLPQLKRLLGVDNTNGTDTVNVVRGAGLVEVPPGEARFVYTDGTTDGIITIGGGGSASGGGSSSSATNIPPFKGALAILSSIKAVAAGVDYQVPFDAESYDTDGFINIATNPTRITIPAGVSKVVLMASANFQNETGSKFITLRKNGSLSFPGAPVHSISAGTDRDARGPLVSPPLEVVEGDYFELNVFSTDADTLDTNGTWLSVMVVEGAASGTAVGRPPFKGAMVTRTTNQTGLSGTSVVTWQEVQYDTGAMWDVGTPTRLTVPAGVSKVRIGATLQFANVTTEIGIVSRISKNGVADWKGRAGQNNDNQFNDPAISYATGVIEVVAGDYFEVVVSSPDTNYDLDASSSCFWMEVVEDTDTAPIEAVAWLPGTPTESVLAWRYVSARVFTLPSGLPNSQGYAETAPSGGAVAFDIRRNGVSIGTMSFADTSKTATFTFAADVSFSPGDRLELVAPASLFSIADISVTLAGVR